MERFTILRVILARSCTVSSRDETDEKMKQKMKQI